MKCGVFGVCSSYCHHRKVSNSEMSPYTNKPTRSYTYIGISNVNKLHIFHHIALVARISLTLSRHSSLSFIALGRSSG